MRKRYLHAAAAPAEINQGQPAVTTSTNAQPISELERENRALSFPTLWPRLSSIVRFAGAETFRARGWSISAIARHLGRDHQTQ